ncbi:MAG: phosphate starvation-inducible protein PhoH [Bacteroidetes bacterium]|nr:phosphate starvation-inducible protein PhoH [Bacteroidota bacterium]
MTEISINIDGIDPLDFFGVNNSKFNLLKKSFPTLRMVSRGNTIKAEGIEDDLQVFRDKVTQMVSHIERHGKVTEDNMERIITGEAHGRHPEKELKNVLVHGNNGHIVRARTDNQQQMVTECDKNDMLFAIGPAGTGKTYTAVALAVRALKEKSVRKIILTRPAVEAGENLGFLPGDLKEKIDPYLRPLYDALEDMIPMDKLAYYMQNRVIEVAPLAFMRGRTLDYSFILLDEAQNATTMQLKMFLTRIGPNSKCIITGDPTQIDLPRSQESGLGVALRILKDINGISQVHLNESDVVRHRLVREIIKAYDTLKKD